MKRRKRGAYGPDAEMAQILYDAARKPQPLRVQDVLALRREEALAALRQKTSAGGAPTKLPPKAKAEIKRRIARGDTKFAADMEAKFPKAMGRRNWNRHIAELRRDKT
jgi:ribosomal protein L29